MQKDQPEPEQATAKWGERENERTARRDSGGNQRLGGDHIKILCTIRLARRPLAKPLELRFGSGRGRAMVVKVPLNRGI